MNIYDVAKEAGVSPSTVSRVLNNKSNVKSSTREKVMRVIEGTSYKPNALARELSVGKSRNIAFLVPDIENPFFSKFCMAFQIVRLKMITMYLCSEQMMIWNGNIRFCGIWRTASYAV